MKRRLGVSIAAAVVVFTISYSQHRASADAIVQVTGRGFIKGVSADSASDVWAVGQTVSRSGTAFTFARTTLTWHLHEGTWTKVASPNPGGTAPGAYNVLRSVSAVSPTDAWAAGSFISRKSGFEQHILLNWDGASWTKAATPDIGVADTLNGVSADSASDAWAVGGVAMTKSSYWDETLVLHWDGTSWTRVPSPSAYGYALRSVDAISPTDVWAVGSNGDNESVPETTLTMHWDGTSWTEIKSPNPGPTQIDQPDILLGVSGTSPSDAWAVGEFKDRNDRLEALILHWNGIRWKRVRPDSGRFVGLYAVSADSSSDAWAVGAGGRKNTLHWDGSAWNVVPTVHRDVDDDQFIAVSLGGVSAVSPTDAFSGGWFYPKLDSLRIIGERWNGTSWTRV